MKSEHDKIGSDGLAADQSDPTPQGRRTRSGAWNLAANIGSLLTSTAFERATRFVLYASVARSLGASDFGRLALSVAIFQVISRFAVLGIPVLATREVAKRPERVASFLANGGMIVLVTTIVGYGAMFAFVSGVGYEQETVRVIWLLFIGLLPFCLSQISQSIFIGLEQAKYVALVNVPVNLAQVVVAFLLLRLGYGIGTIAFSLAIAYTLVAVFQFAVIAVRVRPSWTRPSATTAGGMVRAASPFLGIEGTLVLRSSAGAVIISLLLGEAAVGIYAAAAQLQIPLTLVGSTVGAGLFPVMVRAYDRGVSILANAASRAVEMIVAVLLPAVVGLVMLADELLALIYGGEGFAESTDVLRLVAWAGLAMAVASILGRALVSADKELTTLRIAIVNTATQIFLAVALTIRFGVTGAAAAWLFAAVFNVIQHYVPIRRLFGSFRVWPMVWRPILATIVMALVLLALGGAPVLTLVVIGFASYFMALIGISLWSAGGRAGLRQRWMLVDEIEGLAE